MEHRAVVARKAPDVPSPWTAICVVGVPSQHHRARFHVRLEGGGAAGIDAPIHLADAATRIQIEIESAWPAVLSLEDVELRASGSAPFAAVPPAEFYLYNAQRLATNGPLSALCVAGTMVWQIDAGGRAIRDGARLRMRLRRSPAAPLSPDDPAMAEFAWPERAARAEIARLAVRVGARAR